MAPFIHDTLTYLNHIHVETKGGFVVLNALGSEVYKLPKLFLAGDMPLIVFQFRTQKLLN